MNILDLLRARNIDAKQKQGATTNEYCSSCPVCGGNDRFLTWPDDNRFYCRQCDQGGNLVAFFKFADGLNEQEALEQFFICQGKSATDAADAAELAIKKQAGNSMAKIKTPIRRNRKPNTRTKKTSKVDANLWLQKAETLIEWAHKQLLDNQERLNWLKNERGLTLDTIKRHKIGYNPTDLYRGRNEWGLHEALHNITGKPKKLWIPGGIVLPGYNAKGNLSRVKIRTGGKIKYVLLSGSEIEAAFYGDRALNKFAIVESELDAILLQQIASDIVCPIASGSSAMRPDAATLELIGDSTCLLMFDADEAGIKAASNTWIKELSGAEYWILPAKHGKDCTEAHQKGIDLRLIIQAGLDNNTLAITPEPEPLAEKELSETEQTEIINKALAHHYKSPDPILSELIAEMDVADGNNTELNKVLNKISSFFAQEGAS
jgi:DNA primase